MAKQSRDRHYYLPRLEKESPTHFEAYRAGKCSLTEALQAAGIRSKPTPLKELKRFWKKASPAERKEFLRSIGALKAPAASSGRIVDDDRRLLPAIVTRIDIIMVKRSLRPGEVMREMGLSPYDQSLRMAMNRGTRLEAKMVSKLVKWLNDNKHIS